MLSMRRDAATGSSRARPARCSDRRCRLRRPLRAAQAAQHRASARWWSRPRPASAAPGGPIAIPARASISRASSTRTRSPSELQQDWHWTERYAAQPELLRYANHVADRFDLRRDIRLGTRVAAAHFDEAARRWQRRRATTARSWTARFVVLADRPAVGAEHAGVPRAREVRRSGAALGGLAARAGGCVAGKRVAIIGTGSSAVQLIPILAEQARSLTVFQRTAAYVVPAHNGPLDLGLGGADQGRLSRVPGAQPQDVQRLRLRAVAAADVGARRQPRGSARPRSRSAGGSAGSACSARIPIC